MKYYIDHDIDWISIFLIVSKGSIFYLCILITVIILSKWCIFCRNVYFMLKHMINIEHFYADIYSLLDIIRINKRTFCIDLFIHRDNPLLYLQKNEFFYRYIFLYISIYWRTTDFIQWISGSFQQLHQFTESCLAKMHRTR